MSVVLKEAVEVRKRVSVGLRVVLVGAGMVIVVVVVMVVMMVFRFGVVGEGSMDPPLLA